MYVSGAVGAAGGPAVAAARLSAAVHQHHDPGLPRRQLHTCNLPSHVLQGTVKTNVIG